MLANKTHGWVPRLAGVCVDIICYTVSTTSHQSVIDDTIQLAAAAAGGG